MWEFVTRLFSSDFMPHGHCYYWRPEILWLHVVSDVVIALSYYSIPLALVYLVIKRNDLAFNWMFAMFAAFIFACGTTHLVDVWTVWHGSYRIEGVVKALTAMVSLTTAILLWPLIPKAIKLPSLRRLEEAIEERIKVEEALRVAHTTLEKRVDERTRELKQILTANEEKSLKLERFHKITINRELELVRLKREVNALRGELGQAPLYALPERPSHLEEQSTSDEEEQSRA